jgi:hypothetical protein
VALFTYTFFFATVFFFVFDFATGFGECGAVASVINGGFKSTDFFLAITFFFVVFLVVFLAVVVVLVVVAAYA